MDDNDLQLPTIKETLKKNNVKINKSLGQNFLFDLNLTDKIVKNSEPICSTVIEIGPGPGGLTRSILKKKPTVLYTIDKDKQSEKMLTDIKKIYRDNLIIITDDALHYPIWELGDSPRQVIANLPYNTGTKMLTLWLKHIQHFDLLTLMFQKEVADRIIAKQGSKNYGRLSILTNWLTKSKKLFDIPSEAFIPRPKITSSVIQLKPLHKPLYDVSFESIEKITQMAFSQRRKMIKTSLKKVNGQIILKELNISPNLRPENLSIIDFCKIAKQSFKK
jgi:16S rRNA (adenine1518-N6/adenine1519-N6)-dimethyltransferase